MGGNLGQVMVGGGLGGEGGGGDFQGTLNSMGGKLGGLPERPPKFHSANTGLCI